MQVTSFVSDLKFCVTVFNSGFGHTVQDACTSHTFTPHFAISLCCCRPSTSSSFQPDRQTAARLQQLLSSLDSNQLQSSVGAAVAAVLSSDLQLRQTLLKGASYFALAAGKSGAGHDKGNVQHVHPVSQPELEGQEAQAEGIVELMQASVKKVIEQVRLFVQHNTAQSCLALHESVLSILSSGI